MLPLAAITLGIRIGAATVAVLIVRWLEKRFPIDAGSSDLLASEVLLDFKLAFSNVLLSIIASSIVTLATGDIATWLGGGWIQLRSDPWYWFLGSLTVYVICNDLYIYWTHRLSHMIPALWALHSLHHSAEAVTFVTGARFHWLERIVNGFFPIMAIIFRTPPEIVMIGTILRFLPDVCAHMNVRFSLGRFVMWINSPEYHRIHHSNRPEHFDKNFASVLPLWDVIFGTAWRPRGDEFPDTGLANGEKPATVWEGIIWPLRNSPLLRRAQKSQAWALNAAAKSGLTFTRRSQGTRLK
jgi:sterol desaturase/sphingolipid hydroxylase (fatty acid hydroxylase superfamily)